MQAGGMIVGLWDRALLAADSAVADSGGWGGVTLAHNVGSPAEVDAVLAQAQAAGGTLGRAAAPTEWGGYSGLFLDTEGHPWEVAHNPGWDLQPTAPSTCPTPERPARPPDDQLTERLTELSVAAGTPRPVARKPGVGDRSDPGFVAAAHGRDALALLPGRRHQGLERVNHFEREGVLPIAFSLFHYTNMEDTSFLLIAGPMPIWNESWQEKVQLTIDDHGKHRTVEEMVAQRIGDYEAFTTISARCSTGPKGGWPTSIPAS